MYAAPSERHRLLTIKHDLCLWGAAAEAKLELLFTPKPSTRPKGALRERVDARLEEMRRRNRPRDQARPRHTGRMSETFCVMWVLCLAGAWGDAILLLLLVHQIQHLPADAAVQAQLCSGPSSSICSWKLEPNLLLGYDLSP